MDSLPPEVSLDMKGIESDPEGIMRNCNEGHYRPSFSNLLYRTTLLRTTAGD